MSKPTVQISNARSGTVYITDDAAVEASLLDHLNRRGVPAADAIPVPLEPTSPAQPKGKYKGKGKSKGEMKGGSSDVGQGLPVDAEWARARAWARSLSPPRLREIAPTPTAATTAATTATPTGTPTPAELYLMVPRTPPLTEAVAEAELYSMVPRTPPLTEVVAEQPAAKKASKEAAEQPAAEETIEVAAGIEAVAEAVADGEVLCMDSSGCVRLRWTPPPPSPLAICDSDPNDNDWHSNGVIQ